MHPTTGTYLNGSNKEVNFILSYIENVCGNKKTPYICRVMSKWHKVNN